MSADPATIYTMDIDKYSYPVAVSGGKGGLATARFLFCLLTPRRMREGALLACVGGVACFFNPRKHESYV